jgi:RNA-directed DNA polymerase
MSEIRIEPCQGKQGDIILRENGQTSAWSLRARELDELLKEGKQMNVATVTCAPSNPSDWYDLDWQAVNTRVKKLQVRIAKAVREGRWSKVKALQRLLTSSFAAKALAVRRVTENQGKKTAGIDGETWSTATMKTEAITRLKRQGYRPQPLRRVYIPKGNGTSERRPLGIPCMIDRAMQSLHLLALEPIAETTADKNSYGFRAERNTADAIEQCFKVLCRGTSADYVLEADIKSCFDAIAHAWLEAHIPMDKRVLKQWLNAGFIDRGAFHVTETGVPQGSPISPVMTNMTLDGLETLLAKTFQPQKTKGKRTYPRVHLSRFADDFIVTGSSPQLLLDVKAVIEGFLLERGLRLSETKTHITSIKDGFDFLGQNLRKYKGKLLIQPSKKNVQAFVAKVRRLIHAHRQSSQADLIQTLNPVIKGWANYHRHICSARTFSKVDHLIWQMLWAWAKRRHPTKSCQWVKEHYFPKLTQGWTFSCSMTDASTQSGKRFYRLTKASEVTIKRHIKIKAEANPFDPAFESYFELRLQKKMVAHLQGRNQLLRLWKRQKGVCLICRQTITKQTAWHVHHLRSKTHGGTDVFTNLVMLHPACHQQVHNNPALSVKLLALSQEGLERLEPLT